jgi:hypothetical protein
MEKDKEKTFQELVEEIRSARRGSVEVPEDFADQFLGAVPPSVQNANGFICGEAYSADKHYTFFYKRDEHGAITSYQAELLPINTAKAMLQDKIIEKDGFRFIQLDQHKDWPILIAEEERKYSTSALWLQDPQTKDISLAQELTTWDRRSEVYKIIDAKLEIKLSEQKELVAIGRYGDNNETYLETLEKFIGYGDLKQGGLLNEHQSLELQKEIESKYNKPGEHKFGQDNEDIRQNLYTYEHPLAEKEINGVNLRIAEGLIEGEKYSGERRKTYLLYANGKIAGKFYSVGDIKKVVKVIEDNLVEAIPQKTESRSPQGQQQAEEKVSSGVGALREKVLSGDEVYAIAEKAGSENGDISDIEEVVKRKDYVKRKVSIDQLIKNDEDLREYLNSEPVPQKGRKVTQPIIVADVSRGGDIQKDGVVDGFHRIAQAIANGETKIDAYVQSESILSKEQPLPTPKNEPTGEAVKEEVRRPVQRNKEQAQPKRSQPVQPSAQEVAKPVDNNGLAPDGKETEVNPEARGNEQTGTGIKQEDAENITREAQSSSPNNQGSPRSTRQIKQEQDEGLEIEIKELPTKKVRNKVQDEVKKGEEKVASDTEIKGDDVWESSKKAGSENNNELSRHEDQIKSTSYAKIKIPLDDLVKNDQDLRDFVIAGMGEEQIKRPINQPIIIGNVSREYPLKNDCVLDGFNRVLQAVINNDKEIEAYVPNNSKYLENARSEKMSQDQQKVIVGVNDNAGIDVNDERIYNSKWRGYR